MFDVSLIKAKQGKRKKHLPARDDVFKLFERPLPYYCSVPEQRWQNGSFLKLTRQERGDFLQLVDFIWQGCGAVRKEDVPGIAACLQMTPMEVRQLIDRLLVVKLLTERQGRYVQEELRGQYLQTIASNDNMKRPPTDKKEDDPIEPPF
jgi:hypothetical protein